MDCIGNAACNRIIPTNRSGELLDIAYRAMSTEPADRYANVKELQQAIRDYESHLESIALVQRGNQALADAETTQDYKEFSRSIVAFEEGLALWQSNESAAEGLDNAITAYAKAAYSKSDYELGLSLLDESSTKHKPLIGKLRSGLKERNARQQRIASLRRTAISLVLVMLIGASVATVFCYSEWQRAESMRAEADSQRKSAVKSKEDAVIAKSQAESARTQAEIARSDAEVALTQAEVASASEAESLYLFEIQLANERIHDNAFPSAMRLLDDQIGAIQRKFRHWEWGRLRYLCELEEATLARMDEAATAVMAVAAAPDESRVAIGFADGRVLLWEKQGRSWAKTAISEPTVIDTGRPVTALAISHGGDLLAIGADAGAESDITLYRLGAAPPQPARRMKGHRDAVNSLQFSLDDNRLLSSSSDHTARLWIPFSNDPPQVFYGHFDAVRSARFSHDEQLLVTASNDGSARVWSPKTGAELARFTEHAGAIFAALFLPNDRQVATAGADGAISIWTPSIDEKVRNADNAAKAKSLFADAQVSRVTAMLEDEGTAEAPNYFSIEAHDGHVRALALTAKGSLLVSGGDDSSLRVWDPARLSRQDIETTPLRDQLVRRAKPQDLKRGLLATLRGHGSWISSLVSLDGELRVLSGSYDRTAKVWNLAEYQEVESFDFDGRAVVSAAQSVDGKWLAAALDNGTARVWNKQHEVMQIPPPMTEGHSYLTTNAVLNAKSNRLYTAAGDNTVSVWDYATGGQLKKLTATGREGVLAVSSDDKWMVTGSEGKSAWLWLDGERLAELDHTHFVAKALKKVYPEASAEDLEEQAKVATSACVADAKTIFVGDANGGGWLWSIDQENPDAMTEPQQQRLHGERITSSFFIQDGKQLLTASSDHTVALWTLDKDENTIVRLRLNAPVTVMTVDEKQTQLAAATVLRTQVQRDTWETTARVHLANIGSDMPEKSVRLKLDDGRDVERVNSLSFTPDKSALVIACSVGSNDYLFKWEINRGDELKQLWDVPIYRGSISAALVSPSQDVLTIGGRGGVLWTPQGKRRTHLSSA